MRPKRINKQWLPRAQQLNRDKLKYVYKLSNTGKEKTCHRQKWTHHVTVKEIINQQMDVSMIVYVAITLKLRYRSLLKRIVESVFWSWPKNETFQSCKTNKLADGRHQWSDLKHYNYELLHLTLSVRSMPNVNCQ